MASRVKDLRLKAPAAIIITGSSNSGKTVLAERLICQSGEAFVKPAEEVCWVYARHADDTQMFDRIRSKLSEAHIPVTFYEGFPDEAINNNTLFTKDKTAHKILCLDDVFTTPCVNKTLENLFSITSHHQNLSVILLIHNMFGGTPAQRTCLTTILRSCTYLVVFVGRRMFPIIKSVASSYFAGERHRLIDPFTHLVRQSVPFNYIAIDFVESDVDYQVREQGLVPTDPCHIFLFPSSDGIKTTDTPSVHINDSGDANAARESGASTAKHR